MCSPVRLKYIAALLLCAASRGADNPPALAGHPSLSIAAAANFIPVLGELDTAFVHAEPDVALTMSAGASGNLFAQIRNGAPFDVFLSADLEFPRRLAQDGSAEALSITRFATGRIVLWTTRPEVDMSSIAAVVRSPEVQKLAIANPVTAPYGRAAQQALERLGLAAEAAPKLVTGENISQTAEFVETGNADAGFVALSLVLSPKLKDRGRWIEVPAGLYDPLEHAAVITVHGANNPEARHYIMFLRSAEARKILARFGYGVPK